MEFKNAIISGFQNYFNFEGRINRAPYWYWVLFCVLAGIVLGIIDGVLFGDGAGWFGGLFNLATLVPSIALATRRLHDVNRSGWWQLIAITLIGIIPLIYWLAQPAETAENRFGKNPLAA